MYNHKMSAVAAMYVCSSECDGQDDSHYPVWHIDASGKVSLDKSALWKIEVTLPYFATLI